MNPRSYPLLFCVAAAFGALSPAAELALREDAGTHAISVFRTGGAAPILIQNARPDFRPYIHPIVAPDGRGVLTEFSPSHHRHQTGLFWGFTRLNDRDYFHHPEADYWRRVSCQPLVRSGAEVKWMTTYHLLDASARPVMLETQLWTMRDLGTRYVLELEWTGEALVDLTLGKYDYGGLFVRMPWRAGMEGSVVNSSRQSGSRANAQRAVWADVGLKLEGRSDQAHIAIFDHPANQGYPLPWRVDAQLGVGPSRASLGEWKMPAGQKAAFRHQFLIYTGDFNDMQVDEAWRAYTGERMDSVLWNLAREEGRNAAFLTGEQVVARMTPATGLEVKLFASEPAITQPMAFCWDDRGRLWVAENRDYENRRSGFANSGDSRIVILEDTDGDGKMDTRKVFLEGIPFPAAIAWGFDGLWLGAPPNLLFVPDRDHDDRADSGIEVRLTGWGIQDRHETINSLNWGPDGWLYGCQGYATRSQVGKPADGGRIYRRGESFPAQINVRDPLYIDGGVWRYHPTKDRFEVVAHGFSNPWGIDFDDHGQMFITACVIPHLWHVIPGGVYHRQGGKHINPYVFDDLKTIADHRHRSAHGGARIYLADEFPREYRGRILMANLHERSLLSDILEPRGSGFVGHHGDDTLLANDPQWVGFSVEVGPDGAVYVLDWHDADICGQSVHDKDTGRIFRLAPKGLAGATGLDLAKRTDRELADLQLHRNDWYVRRSRLLLQQRAAERRLDATVPGRLWEIFGQQQDTGRKLRALWALHVIGGLDAGRLLPLLDHAAPHVRAWAIQLLGEDSAPGAAAAEKFAAMARSDPSPVVRLYLAAVLQRLPSAERWSIATGLLRHGEDADDHNLPKMIWYGIEPLVPENPERALELAGQSAIPLVSRFIARRATVGRQTEAVARVLAGSRHDGVRQILLEGMRDGLGAFARRELAPPSRWAAVDAELQASGNAVLRNLARQIGQSFGDPKAMAAQLQTLQDSGSPAETRREILLGFARDGYAPAVPAALALLDDPALRRDAIRALASFDDPRIAAGILTRYARWSLAERSDAILTLIARSGSAARLVDALKRQEIPRRDVSAFAARQLQRVLGPSFVDYWGRLDQPPEYQQAEIARLKRMLSDEFLAQANLANGRALFDRTCAACHVIYGHGGNIGPDLTGSNRANLDYILGEIITPSDVIQEGYQLVTITTQDGRTLAGNLASEDSQQVTLRLIGQELVIAKSTILNRETSKVSMMPEGLLKSLSSDEVRDLIAYLRTTRQVPLPAP